MRTTNTNSAFTLCFVLTLFGLTHVHLFSPPNMFFLFVFFCVEQSVDKGLGVWRGRWGGEKGLMGGELEEGMVGDGWMAVCVFVCVYVHAFICHICV